jgi:hypothetical protein
MITEVDANEGKVLIANNIESLGWCAHELCRLTLDMRFWTIRQPTVRHP